MGCLSDLLIIMIIYYHINPNNLADCKNVQNFPLHHQNQCEWYVFSAAMWREIFLRSFFFQKEIYLKQLCRGKYIFVLLFKQVYLKLLCCEKKYICHCIEENVFEMLQRGEYIWFIKLCMHVCLVSVVSYNYHFFNMYIYWLILFD